MGNLVGKGGDEQGGRLHVDADAAGAVQVFPEGVVVLPHAAVGRVDRARVVVLLVGDDGVGDGLLQPERRQGRDFAGIIALQRPLRANGGDR